MEHFKEQFAKLRDSLPGKDIWTSNMRSHAMDKFLTQGLPDRNNEQWKYTSLYSLASQDFNCILKQELGGIDIKLFSDWYIIFDGDIKYNLPKGIVIQSLQDAIQEQDIKQFLNKSKLTHHNGLFEMNLALMSQGYFIRVEKNIIISEPIHIIFPSSIDKGITNIRNILSVSENAKVHFIEHYIGNNEYCNNVTTEIFLDENCQCVFDNIQEESLGAYHLADVLVAQNSNSSFCWKSFSFGGKLSRTYIEVELKNGAECNLQGMSALKQAQHVDYNTLIKHVGSNSNSYEDFKGVYSDSSQGVFKGDIRVSRGAKNIFSKQINNNILLSNTAKVNTQPRLEIYDNEVQCSHGATIGQLDKEALFYLQTRGVSEKDAKLMLLSSFINPILVYVKHNKLLQYLNAKIESVFKMI